MSGPWTEWDHVVKVDPDKDLPEGETFEDVAATGTDAIEVGGTTGVTDEKMHEVLDAAGATDVPVYVEPSNPANAVDRPEVDGFLVPVVLNAGDPAWITGMHKEWVRLDGAIRWETVATEAYVVMNPESAVGAYTQANCDIQADDVAAYAEMAERMFGQEIVYLEYSGTFGDPEVVGTAADALEAGTLFYGGGIHDYESARTMGAHADVVIVGDLVHEEGCDAVRETVEGARDA